MKQKVSRHERESDRDTMRPEYDFSAAVRGATAARYAQGANIAVIDPEVLDVFPDSATVNRTLRARPRSSAATTARIKAEGRLTRHRGRRPKAGRA